MSEIDSIIDAYYYEDLTTTTDTTASSQLDSSDFLQLLVVQLQNQDPLEPMENTEFIAQLAQFSSLEQEIALNENMASLLDLQTFNYANSLIGKEVYWYDENGDAANGIVDYVEFASFEEPVLFIGDYGIYLSEVLATGEAVVEETAEETTLSLNDLEPYLGKRVTWYNDDGDQETGVVNRIELLVDGTPAMIVPDSNGDEQVIQLSEVIAVETV